MATTQQPLAVRSDAPVAFGSRDEIQAIADRIRVMLPSAHLSDWQLKRNDRAAIQKKLDESVYRAAQLSVFYRLVPGEDVHVIPFGNNWAVDMGIETWKKAADRYCSLHHITYHIHTEEMSVEELKERRGDDYHPDDCGMVAYLWRSDKQGVYEIFGAKQSMSRAVGVWARNAKWINGKDGKDGYWQADTIPAHRAKQDVAKRRAMKAVLKLEFSLDSLLAATPNEVRGSIGVMNSRLDSEERVRAMPVDRRVEFEDEDCCFVREPSASKPRDMQFVVVDEDGTIEQDEEAEEGTDASYSDLWDAPADADEEIGDVPAGIDYITIDDRLDDTCERFVAATKNAHANSNGAATAKQYQYLAGVINKLTGQPDSHNDVLGVLIGREVDSSNPPGFDLCQKLLDYLVKEKSERDRHGTKVKVANLAYRQDYADCIVSIWQAVREAQP